MNALTNQLVSQYRTAERETKIAWHLRFIIPILTHAQRSLKNYLDSLYITLVGALEVVDMFSNEDAQRELENIRRIQKTFIHLEPMLDKSSFLGDAEIKEKWNNCLDNLYKLEGEMRIKIYSGREKDSEDKALIRHLSEKSSLNIESVLARYAV